MVMKPIKRGTLEMLYLHLCLKHWPRISEILFVPRDGAKNRHSFSCEALGNHERGKEQRQQGNGIGSHETHAPPRNCRLAPARWFTWKARFRLQEAKSYGIRGRLFLARVFKALPDAARESELLANKDCDQQSARCFRDTDVTAGRLAGVAGLGARACKEERSAARAANSAGVGMSLGSRGRSRGRSPS
jgi:hypothetical protein